MHCFKKLPILVVITMAAIASYMPASHAADVATPKVISKVQGIYGGYLALPHTGDPATFRAVTTTWTEPTLNCSDGKALGMFIWAGLDGGAGSTLEQAGVGDGCYQGQQTGGTFVCMYVSNPGYCGNDPQVYPNVNVVAGHVYTQTIVTPSATQPKYVFTLKDVTAGVTDTVTALCPAGTTCANRSADAVIEPQTSGLPNFGVVHFTKSYAINSNGVIAGLVSTYWNSIKNSIVNNAGAKTITCATPGPFNQTTNSFDVTWKKNACGNLNR